MNGTFTRLKKYSSPTQVMPARKWNHRRISMAASLPVMVGMTTAVATSIRECIDSPSQISVIRPEAPETLAPGIAKRFLLMEEEKTNRPGTAPYPEESRQVCTSALLPVNRE